MARVLIVQTLGSALVPMGFLLSQGAARLLDAFPSSATAWYLNLAVFSPLQQVRAVPSQLAWFLDRATTTEFVLTLLLAGAIHIVRFRVGVALLAHLAFLASLFVARAWVTDLHGSIAPGLLLEREGGGTALVMALIAATGLACATSHLSFILDILRTEVGSRALERRSLWLAIGDGPREQAPSLVLELTPQSGV